MRRHIAAETQKLEAAIPAWRDPKRKVSRAAGDHRLCQGPWVHRRDVGRAGERPRPSRAAQAWLFDQGKD